MGHLITNALARPFLHLLIPTRRPRRKSQLWLSGSARAVPSEPPSLARPVTSHSSPPSAMASSEFETTRPLSCIRFLLSERWLSLCVTGEDKVARFGLIVAGEAGFHESSVGSFAVLEVSETPTASRGVLLCILDHKLNVRWSAGYERLGLAKDFVVFLRRHVTVV